MRTARCPRYPFRQAVCDLRADLDRYVVTSGRPLVAELLLSPGSIASVSYRLARWLWQVDGPATVLARVARVPMAVVNRLVEVWSGVSIPPSTAIGPGLYVGHFGEVILNGDVEIGANCNLSQGVTIGVGGPDRRSPRLGDRVHVGPGAKIFGGITVGDDAVIGANAVVTKDVPSRGVAYGVPATVTSFQGSFSMIAYRDMELDEARAAALRVGP
jgi:serine O-acetyltransferase